MIVKCVSNKGYMFSLKYAREGHNQTTTYNDIKLNKKYYVYGIVLFEEEMRYLIYDDTDPAAYPYWYPADLFEICDHALPNNWYFSYDGIQDEGTSAIWGYKELVFSEKHFDGLSELELTEIELFLERKEDMYK